MRRTSGFIIGSVAALAWPVLVWTQSPAVPAAPPQGIAAPAAGVQAPAQPGAGQGRGGPALPANQPAAPRNEMRHQGFVEIAKKGNIDLLLHGDSITDWWLQDANKPMFDKYFGNIRTANFAVAGDTTQGVLWGLRNGEGQGFQPKAVMLMIGTNNSGNSTSEEMAEGVGAVVLELRRNFPDAKILLLAIFPRGRPGDPIRDKVTDANEIIRRLDDQKHVFYLDIGPKFLDDKGFFLPDTFRPDNLHPVAGGYDIWGAAVRDTLAKLLK